MSPRQAVRAARPAVSSGLAAAGRGTPAPRPPEAVSGAAGVVRLVLPWDPCAVPDNAAYRSIVNRRTGKISVKLSDRGVAAKAAIALYAASAMRGRPPLTGRLALVCVAFAPDARRRDTANLRKLATDALQGAVYADDAQLDDERWRRGPIDRETPRLEITVGPADAWADFHAGLIGGFSE